MYFRHPSRVTRSRVVIRERAVAGIVIFRVAGGVEAVYLDAEASELEHLGEDSAAAEIYAAKTRR
jgi:hypothetical protein